MNKRIDWIDGSFEFISKQELENMKIKKYDNSIPFSFCENCTDRDCEANRSTAQTQAYKLFGNHFFEPMSAAQALQAIKGADVELRQTIAETSLWGCVAVHLMQLIDEETSIDVTDELGKTIYSVLTDNHK